MALDSEFVVEYHWTRSTSDTDVILAAFDRLTGDRRDLFGRGDGVGDGLRARYDLSAETHVVLEPADGSSIVGTFSTLEVATGELTRDAFTIDPPWLCTDEGCFRD
jgi:hypothetical protein